MASLTNIATEALVTEKPGDKFEMRPIILDEVRGDEVLVEMKYSGICHTVCHPISMFINSGNSLFLGCSSTKRSHPWSRIPCHLWS